jgi:hypothetical protein
MIISGCEICKDVIRLDFPLGMWVGADDRGTRCPGMKGEFSAHRPPYRYVVLQKAWDAMSEADSLFHGATPMEYLGRIADSFQAEVAGNGAGRHHPDE